MDYWSDKVALVTGGSTGLGLAIARSFAAHGAKVVIAARDQDRLQSAVAQLRATGAEVEGVTTDVTDQEQVDSLVARTRDLFGRLDVLVNNVGRSARGEALATTPEEFQQYWDLNFLSVVRCTRAAAPLLLQSRGVVVNIGSLAAKTATRYLGAYPATKFALAAYSQQLRQELRPKGVHVLFVCPGPISREDAGQRYDDEAQYLPESARRPGGGVKLNGLSPHYLAERILSGCRQRRAELVLPWKARLLFVVAQLWPEWGDWILRRFT